LEANNSKFSDKKRIPHRQKFGLGQLFPSATVGRLMCVSLFSLVQIRVGANDDSWVYGNYICRASNFVGTSSTVIQLRQASQCCRLYN